MESSSPAVVTSGGDSRKRRQKRSVAEKRRIVEEALLPGASVAQTARAHGINANQVFAWRNLYLAGKLVEKQSSSFGSSMPRLLPVSVSDEAQPAVRSELTAPTQVLHAGSQSATGMIHLQFPNAQLRVEGIVDVSTLRVVLECLLR
jgi:transposase